MRSTHIYCRPSCPARRPLRRNVIFFRSRFRKRSSRVFVPAFAASPTKNPRALRLVERAARALAQPGEEIFAWNRSRENLAPTPSALRRAFQQITGLAPRDLADALRLKRFKSLLRAGKNITDALYETGYGSSSRVYERSDAQLGMTPSAYQKGGEGMKLNYTVAKSPLGKVLVAATEKGVSAVYLGGAEDVLLAELKAKNIRARKLLPPKQSYQRWVGGNRAPDRRAARAA